MIKQGFEVKQKKCVELHAQGKKNKEISDIVGISTTTVAVYLRMEGLEPHHGKVSVSRAELAKKRQRGRLAHLK